MKGISSFMHFKKINKHMIMFLINEICGPIDIEYLTEGELSLKNIDRDVLTLLYYSRTKEYALLYKEWVFGIDPDNFNDDNRMELYIELEQFLNEMDLLNKF